MDSSKQLALPVTPERRQRAVSRLPTRSSLTDELESTPDFSPKLSPLEKRTFGEISQPPAPQFAGAALPALRRQESLDHEIQYFEVPELAVVEAAGKEDQFLSKVQNELSTLEAEKIILLE
ncbi:MAG: hypothetical protein L6R36_009341 [Xanthoria steineri]|nr:MAG: hypothetical protein L6R36_009341 [Xanthoria steineri]